MNIQNAQHKGRDKNQRGAALITVLMMSTLMLATGGALLLVTGLSNRTAIDATAERQAYYSAEAGVQDTLNVLRGNVNPQGGMPADIKISFLGAMDPAVSNHPSDSSGLRRLSGWLNYNYSNGNDSRVALTGNYSPLNGLAYSVLISDPDNTVAGTEPSRLLISVRGYGPKGAEKRMELIIRRSNFEFTPPAMLLMRGDEDCDPMTFTIGNSNAKEYSGHDRSGGGILPAFGATCGGDYDIEIASDSKDTVDDPKAQNLTNPELPTWLRTADEARAFLAEQKANAISEGRYFGSYSGNSGTSDEPVFTFVDGDCNLDGGAGLLIVTGNLTLSGNPSFDGIILVLGDGHVQRNGGGNGDIYGALVVAKFGDTGGFLQPFFDTNGGGNSLMKYDSAAVRRAMGLSGPRVLGVHEQ
ncbi:MAG: hypothetical protein ACXWID_10205 [Pyrinomonadaceae bacterium]